MALFEVHTENRWEELIWQNKAPESYEGIILKGSDPTALTGDFGKMLFQRASAAKYSIWLNNYLLDADRTFIARLDFPTIELGILLGNNALYRLQPIGEVDMKETQFNITYAPYMENRVRLKGAHQYTTFDIHFQLSYFEKLAEAYPDDLLPFLEQVSSGNHTTFYETPQYAAPLMLSLSREILRVLSYEVRDGLKLDLLVKLLCIDAITRRPRPNSPLQAKRAQERDIIRHITTLILSDTSRIKTTRELSLEAGMNTKDLRYRFKEENGMSIRRYWQQYRMERIREMIINNPELTMREIAHTFGYSDSHSLGRAFKKHYHNPPTHFHK